MKDQIVKQLYDYAVGYKMTEFSELFSEYQNWQGEARPETNLLCAQLMLMTADSGFAAQLEQAKTLSGKPIYPCLYHTWQLEDANAFILFDKEPDSLMQFLKGIRQAVGLMQNWYGDAGAGMCDQITSEILYFTGRTDEAAELAVRQCQRAGEDRSAYLLAGYVLLRSYMALGESALAQEVLMDIISATHENDKENFSNRMYRNIRSWVNLTTGWSGDMPRYYYTPDNIVLPVLEDRTSEILKGIDKLGPTEEPFLEYARTNNRDVCTMRQLYMDIFYAVYHFRVKQRRETRQYFTRAYLAARPNDLIMPFVEYGNQIIPLLEHMSENENGYDQDWLNKVITCAEKYEKGLVCFRTM